MKNKWKSSAFLAGTAMLGAVALSGTTGIAGTVNMTIAAAITSSLTETVTTELDFASIEILPAGDTITIDASGAGGGDGGAAAVAAATGASALSGVSTSGLITIASAIGFDVDVVYPADSTVVITDGTTSTFLNNIDALSGGGTTDTTVTHAAGVDTLIHVGGEIVFPAGSTTGSYAGAMDITINYS